MMDMNFRAPIPSDVGVVTPLLAKLGIYSSISSRSRAELQAARASPDKAEEVGCAKQGCSSMTGVSEAPRIVLDCPDDWESPSSWPLFRSKNASSATDMHRPIK